MAKLHWVPTSSTSSLPCGINFLILTLSHSSSKPSQSYLCKHLHQLT